MKSGKDPAPAGMRDQVAMAVSQAWREPVSAMWLGRAYRRRFIFRVPGLRHDGTLRGDHRARWFFGKLLWFVPKFLYSILLLLITLIWIPIDSLAFDIADSSVPDPPSWRDVTVKAGALTGGAVAAGRSLTGTRGHLWLVVSAHGTAFTQVADGSQQVLWADNTPGRPQLVIKKGQLHWPDGSSLGLDWPRAESRRFT